MNNSKEKEKKNTTNKEKEKKKGSQQVNDQFQGFFSPSTDTSC